MTNRTAFGEQAVAQLTPMAGWTFAYNVNADLVATTTSGDGTVTSDSGFAVLSTAEAAESVAQITSRLALRYIPGQGAIVRFTAVFSEGVVGSQQLIGVGDSQDGLFFGYNGATFGIMRRYGGVDNWIAIGNWSEGRINYDWSKGNVFQIQYQWLGFGEIKFSIENPVSGAFETIHRIRYANTATVTSLLNPTLPVMARVENTTNDTVITLKTPSAMAFVEGQILPPPPHPLALPQTITATKVGITTRVNVLTLSSPATWQDVNNRIRSQMLTLSVATDGTKPVSVRLTKNAVLGGTPNFTDYSAQTSPIQFDTAGTTLTGGTAIFAATLAKEDSQIFDLERWGVLLNPGETITISALSTSSTTVDLTMNWVDLL